VRKIEIPVDDMKLSARAAGDRNQPALILLHGWPHSGRVYDDVIPDLSEDAFVLAFDLPGVGDSQGAPPSAEKTVLADIVLRAAEKLEAKSILIAGFDVGGMIAYSAARDHGSRIVGAVVMNTVIPGLDLWEETLADPQIFHFALHAVPKLPELLVTGHEREYFDFFFDVLAGNKAAVTDGQRDEYARAYSRPEALTAGFDWYRAFEADAKHNARHKRIRTPILYLRGDAGIVGDAVEPYVAGLRKAGAEHVTGGIIRNSGEFSPVEAPAAFVKALKDFRVNIEALAEA
jgi:pimeloyl-ACP methyl ester carboxylesterase